MDLLNSRVPSVKEKSYKVFAALKLSVMLQFGRCLISVDMTINFIMKSYDMQKPDWHFEQSR